MNYQSKLGVNKSFTALGFCMACYHACSGSCSGSCSSGCSGACANNCEGDCGNNCTDQGHANAGF